MQVRSSFIRFTLPLILVLNFFSISGVYGSAFEDKSEGEDDAHPHLFTKNAPQNFAVDGKLKVNFDFWVRIYTQYDTQQGLVHDAKYIDKIYEIIDLKDTAHSKRLMKQTKKKWKEALLSLQKKVKKDHPIDLSKLNAAELKIYELYKDVDGTDKYQAAAHRKRLRIQIGQKDQFLDGYIQSGKYLPHMEEIFSREKMPIELTRLPFVESSFNVRARSKVGASGIWQFMRSTGRLFLKINDAVDERNDPIRATEAAVKLLRLNFESLRAWPLAVTAYNHGRQGMMRAVRKVGSEDIEDVVGEYRSRSFGFASSNFFTELLAAIEVEKNAEKYFGKVDRDKVARFFEYELPANVYLKDFIKFIPMEIGSVKDLNPGLTELIYKNQRRIPAGYRFRVALKESENKESALQAFEAKFREIPSNLTQTTRRRQGK